MSVRSKPRKNKLAPKTATWRRITAWLLIIFAATLLAIGNIAFWAGNTMVKEDRFKKATAPIIQDPVVQQNLALYTTNKIFDNIDAQKVIVNALPPRADFLAPQLASQLKITTENLLQKALAKPKVQEAFNNSLIRQQQRLINLTANYKGDGTVNINDAYQRLVANLKDTRLAFLADKQLPANVGEVEIISAPRLPLFHKVVTNIDLWRNLAIGLMIVSLGLGLWLSQRRRTIYYFGALTVLLMTATILTVRILRDHIANTADSQYVDGVKRVLQIFTHSLMVQTLIILFSAIVLSAIVWVSGNSPRSTRLKKRVTLFMDGKYRQSLIGPKSPSWAKSVRANRRLLQWLVLAVATIVLLLVSLSIWSLVIYLLVLAVLELSIEFVAGPTKS